MKIKKKKSGKRMSDSELKRVVGGATRKKATKKKTTRKTTKSTDL